MAAEIPDTEALEAEVPVGLPNTKETFDNSESS